MEKLFTGVDKEGYGEVVIKVWQMMETKGPDIFLKF